MFGRVFWLEHLDDAAIDEMIAALAEHHVVVDPTLMAMRTKFWGDAKHERSRPRAGERAVRKEWPGASFTRDWTPEQYAAAKRSWPILLKLTRAMYDRGVELAAIPPLAIIRIATYNAARALHREKELGSIAPGLRADLVILSKNPLESITNTRAIDHVIQSGAVLTAP